MFIHVILVIYSVILFNLKGQIVHSFLFMKHLILLIYLFVVYMRQFFIIFIGFDLIFML